MNNLDQQLTAIISEILKGTELDPMKLSEGCVYLHKETSKNLTVRNIHEKRVSLRCSNNNARFVSTLRLEKEFEILGHSLTLNHLLMALKRTEQHLRQYKFDISSSEIREYFRVSTRVSSKCHFDLTKPLLSQEEETKKFILKVLN